VSCAKNDPIVEELEEFAGGRARRGRARDERRAWHRLAVILAGICSARETARGSEGGPRMKALALLLSLLAFDAIAQNALPAARPIEITVLFHRRPTSRRECSPTECRSSSTSAGS
jgi:hypothetical protein